MRIIFYFLITFLFSLFILRKSRLTEVLATSILLSIGIAGTIPFLLKEYLSINYGFTSQYLFFVTLIFLIAAMIFKRDKRWNIDLLEKPNAVEILLCVVMLLFLIRSIPLPIRGWDSYSLYDLRAKIFLSEEKLSVTKSFSDYDNYNPSYYYSYPPMTSVFHAMVYISNFQSPMFVYFLLYYSVIFYVYLIVSRLKINRIFKFGFFAVSCFFPLLVEQMWVAYTNLPFLAFQLAAIYYLLKYFSNKNSYFILISAVFGTFSSWTRTLDVNYIGLMIATFVVIFFTRKKNFFRKSLLFVGYLLILLSLRWVWFSYVNSSIGGIGETMPGFMEFLTKVPGAFLLTNIVDVAMFVSFSLGTLKYYLLLFGLAFLFHLRGAGTFKLGKGSILLIYIATNFLLSILGTFYFSQTFYWWDKIGGSFLRSSLYLVIFVPLYASLILEGKGEVGNNKLTGTR